MSSIKVHVNSNDPSSDAEVKNFNSDEASALALDTAAVATMTFAGVNPDGASDVESKKEDTIINEIKEEVSGNDEKQESVESSASIPESPLKRKGDDPVKEAADTAGKTEATADAIAANVSSTPAKKRKTTTTPKEPKEPKTPKDTTKSSAWTPEEESALMELVKENPKANPSTLSKLLAEKGIVKLPGAISNKKRRLKNAAYEWTEEQIADIKRIVDDYKSKKVDPFLIIANEFLGGALAKGVKKEAAVKKIKDLEKEGILNMEGLQGFKKGN